MDVITPPSTVGSHVEPSGLSVLAACKKGHSWASISQFLGPSGPVDMSPTRAKWASRFATYPAKGPSGPEPQFSGPSGPVDMSLTQQRCQSGHIVLAGLSRFGNG